MLRPRPIHVTPLENHQLFVIFDTGEEKIFDVTPYIQGDWYGKLADSTFFKTVHIEASHVVWADGQDIAPHELYDNAIPTVFRQNSSPTA